MKLRCFYFLCYLVCIDWSFCYDYIENGKAIHPNRHLRKSSKQKNGRQKNQHRRWRRQELEEEKDSEASIDIASFIQQPDPDYESVDDPGQYYSKRRRDSNNYDDISSLNDLQLSLDNQKEYLDKSNIPYNDELRSLESSPSKENAENADYLAEKGKITKLDRRRQAMPFFSHKTKEKKQKKRKHFKFGLKTTTTTTILPKYDGQNPDLKNHLAKVVKRSNGNRYCPLCKRKYIQKPAAAPKNIQNSRQYYRSIADSAFRKQKKADSGKEYQNKLNNQPNLEEGKVLWDRNRREKRHNENNVEENNETKVLENSQNVDFEDKTNRQRQSKELEEVQRKVDSVEINIPKSYSTNY